MINARGAAAPESPPVWPLTARLLSPLRLTSLIKCQIFQRGAGFYHISAVRSDLVQINPVSTRPSVIVAGEMIGSISRELIRNGPGD